MAIAQILVATDFSEHADAAARLGIALARGLGASICLLHVDRLPEHLGEDADADAAGEDVLVGVRPGFFRQYREASQRQVRADLARAVRALAPWSGGVAIETAIDYGDVAEAIERRARGSHVDLVVLGSHGMGASERPLFGSALARLLPRAPCPLLVTRAAQRDRLPGERGFERPLVAIDYSRFAEPATRLARGLAAPGSAIDLVHVWRPPVVFELEEDPTLGEDDRRNLAAAAELTLVRERERLAAFRRRTLGDTPARCEVGRGRVASALLDHARQHGNDVVVVGAHGPDASGGIGNVTDRVLRHAGVPVLFVPDLAAPDRRPGPGNARSRRSTRPMRAVGTSARPH